MFFDDPQTAEEWLEQQARRKATEPDSWLSEAGILKAAGDAIREDQERLQREVFWHPVSELRKWELIGGDRLYTVFAAVMLWGFALENLLKGLLIADGTDVLRVQGLKVQPTWGSKGHDLVWLADQAKVRLADGERGLLARVSVITRWGGRYPLAFDLEDMRGLPH